jgi:hypothetical protein
MVYFKLKNPNLGKFWGACNGRGLYILWPFCILYGHLVSFMDIWYICWLLCIPPFWLVLPSKIWQPCPTILVSNHPFTTFFLKDFFHKTAKFGRTTQNLSGRQNWSFSFFCRPTYFVSSDRILLFCVNSPQKATTSYILW